MAEEITHKEIYERLVSVEDKVDRIDENTKEVTTAFAAAKGAATRSMNSAPFRAERQAWVAMALKRETPRRRTFSALTRSAARARSMAASESLPVCERPSPSRTIRE